MTKKNNNMKTSITKGDMAMLKMHMTNLNTQDAKQRERIHSESVDIDNMKLAEERDFRKIVADFIGRVEEYLKPVSLIVNTKEVNEASLLNKPSQTLESVIESVVGAPEQPPPKSMTDVFWQSTIDKLLSVEDTMATMSNKITAMSETIKSQIIERQADVEARDRMSVMCRSILECISSLVRIEKEKSEAIYPTGSEKFVIHKNQLCKKQSHEPIPQNEPVFILRGRDKYAVRALAVYCQMLEGDNQITKWQSDLTAKSLNNFRMFAQMNPETMKLPGSTMGR